MNSLSLTSCGAAGSVSYTHLDVYKRQVLLAIGVTPDTHLATEAGLELGIRGSIAVNERMETSVPDIYAVGDAVEVTHFVTGQKAFTSLPHSSLSPASGTRRKWKR